MLHHRPASAVRYGVSARILCPDMDDTAELCTRAADDMSCSMYRFFSGSGGAHAIILGRLEWPDAGVPTRPPRNNSLLDDIDPGIGRRSALPPPDRAGPWATPGHAGIRPAVLPSALTQPAIQHAHHPPHPRLCRPCRRRCRRAARRVPRGLLHALPAHERCRGPQRLHEVGRRLVSSPAASPPHPLTPHTCTAADTRARRT